MPECIHGFDDGLCAICFPPKAPEPQTPVKAERAPRTRAAGTRAASPRTATAARTASTGRAVAPSAPVDAKTMRIYHFTHLDNLARILGTGALLADASGAEPVVDVSAPAARDYRRSAEVDGAPIGAYVPFALAVDAPVWEAIRTSSPDPRLAPAATERPAADHVILVSSVGAALGARADSLVLTDLDASLPGAVATGDWAEIERLLRRLAVAEDPARLPAAELLVRDRLPLERIALIAVANDRVRDRVRAALTAVGARTRVAVYPPWFSVD